MTQRYFERIGYTGDSGPLLADIASAYNLGSVHQASVLEVGYEDCNVAITTDSGKFVVKAFAKFRDQAQIDRYVDIMDTAIEGGVHHPGLHKTRTEHEVFNHPTGISLVVMDFIDGGTYFDNKTVPDDEELKQIMSEAVKIHALPIRPSYLYDSWAIPNIRQMFDLTERFIDDEGQQLARAVMQRYEAINTNRLPTCFTHGDIIKTNTLKDRDGKIWILDFAVANIYPRLQELAVVAANLLHDTHSFRPLSTRIQRTNEAYLAAGGELTDYEKKASFDYALAGLAMEFMGGYKAKFIDGEKPEEAEYWIELGRRGIKEALS